MTSKGISSVNAGAFSGGVVGGIKTYKMLTQFGCLWFLPRTFDNKLKIKFWPRVIGRKGMFIFLFFVKVLKKEKRK